MTANLINWDGKCVFIRGFERLGSLRKGRRAMNLFIAHIVPFTHRSPLFLFLSRTRCALTGDIEMRTLQTALCWVCLAREAVAIAFSLRSSSIATHNPHTPLSRRDRSETFIRDTRDSNMQPYELRSVYRRPFPSNSTREYKSVDDTRLGEMLLTSCEIRGVSQRRRPSSRSLRSTSLKYPAIYSLGKLFGGVFRKREPELKPDGEQTMAMSGAVLAFPLLNRLFNQATQLFQVGVLLGPLPTVLAACVTAFWAWQVREIVWSTHVLKRSLCMYNRNYDQHSTDKMCVMCVRSDRVFNSS